MAISGTWEGHYFSNWISGEQVPMDETSRWAFPIRMEITQTGDAFVGSMSDLANSLEMAYREYFELAQKSMTWLQKMEAKKTLQLNPEFVIRTELPVHSSIEGNVRGREVSFVKVYDGRTVTSWVLNNQETIHKIDSPPVHYNGELNENDDLITGTFLVIGNSPGAGRTKGKFRLRRVV